MLQRHGVDGELHDLRPQVKVLEEVSRGGFLGVDVLVRPMIANFKVQDEVEKLPESPLVKHAQQICNDEHNLDISVWRIGTPPAFLVMNSDEKVTPE